MNRPDNDNDLLADVYELDPVADFFCMLIAIAAFVGIGWFLGWSFAQVA